MVQQLQRTAGNAAVARMLQQRALMRDETATWVASVGGPAKAATYKPEQFAWTTDESDAWEANAVSTIQGIWGNQYRRFTQKSAPASSPITP